jgi:hypothetical protein
LAHLSARSEAVNVEVGCPEKLAEILRALQLHLDILHVPVEIFNQNSSILAVLLQELLELVHVLII